MNFNVPLRVTLVHGEHDEDDNIKPDYIIYSLDISSFLDDTESEASLIVCPNDFTDASDLKSFNDRTGIVPMNKGKNTDIGPVVVPEEPEEGGEGGEGGSGEGNNGEGG